MRLSTKLLLTTCISPALIWLVGVYVVKASQDQLRAAIQTAAMAEVRSMQEEIDRLLRARTNTWEKFSKDEEVIATLVKSNEMLRKKEGLVEEIALVWSDEERRRNLPDGVLDRALSRELGSTVDKMTELSGGTEIFHGVMLTNAFGGIVAQSSPTAGYLHDGSVWWQEAKASSPYIGDVTVGRDGNRQEEVSISFCLRLNDQEGEFVGIMRVEINLQEVLDVVDSYARRGGRDQGMVLLNSEGRLIRIGGRGRTRTLSDGRRYLVPNESGRLEGTQVLEKDASGREQVYTYAVPPEEGIVSSLGWLAVHTAEADTLLAPVRQLRNNVILAAAMATILGVAVMLWVVFPVSRRMKRLVEATKQIGKGTTEAPISVAGRDELSELSHEFNQMRARLGEAQKKLREAMERAKEASKAKGDFLANMSHEIRTPMNAIMGITELTLGTNLTEEQRHYQILVEQSAQALLMLLNDILDYSKIEAGKLELERREFDLRGSVGDMLHTLFPRAAEKDLELAFRVDPAVPRILAGDLTRLRQVVVNLVGNALKFTDQGEVLVSVEAGKKLDGQIELLFKVRDTGVGVRADRTETIFEMFEQADSSTTREFGGSGLGLAISRRIVKKMGGEIWVESVEGEGSTFYFTGIFDVGATEKSSEADILRSLDGLPVLVVEDNTTQREIVGEMLNNWRMTGILCPDAESALAKLEELEREGQEVKLGIIDRAMPGTDGLQLARRIRGQSRWSDLPMILLGSVSEGTPDREIGELGIMKVVNKPIKHSMLLDAIMLTMGMGNRLPRLRDGEAGEHQSGVAPMEILLAEDGKVNQLVAVRLLERRGHRVTVVENGLEAVDRARKENFDVILMDIQMPLMSGFEASQEIRAREQKTGGHVPIIAMTAYAMPGDSEECLNAGMDDYISKPIESDEFYGVVERFGSGTAAAGEPIGVEVVSESETEEIQCDGKKPDEKVFDPDGFRSRIGDELLMCELIRIFEEESGAMRESLMEAERKGDAAALHESAHRLKGLVGNYCASRTWDCVTELDERVAAGDLVAASELVFAFERELRFLEDALREFRELLETKLQPS